MIAGSGDWTTSHARNDTGDRASGIDSRPVEGSLEGRHRIGKVLKKIHIHIKAQNKCQIFRAQDFTEEGATNFFLHGQHAFLAAAGVDENTEGKGQVGFSGEIFDGLRLRVFENLEVILSQIGNQPAFFVFDIEKQLDHVHVYLEGGHCLVAGLGLIRSGLIVLTSKLGKLLGGGKKRCPGEEA